MSKANVQNTNTRAEVYMDPTQEAKLGLLILSKRIDDLDSSLSSRLDALESIAAAAESTDEESESIWEICDEIAASEASRYHLEEAERRKRRREIDLKLSNIRSKRAKAEKKATETAARKAELRKKLVDGLKAFVASWTWKRTCKFLFAIITVLSMFMYFKYYNIITSIVSIIPSIFMLIPSYIRSRSQLMSELGENDQFLFLCFEGYVAMCGIFNTVILLMTAMFMVFNF